MSIRFTLSQLVQATALALLLSTPSAHAERAFALDSGGSTSCAIVDGGLVQCWGHNDHGQLGANKNPVTSPHSSSPLTVVTADGEVLRNAVALAVGENYHAFVGGYGHHACAVTADGHVWCWGHNNHGQLGDHTTTDSRHAVQVIGDNGQPLRDIQSVAAGGAHTCAITTQNNVYCWGRNHGGQLGRRTVTASEPRPHWAVYTSGARVESVVEIGLGEAFSCARLSDGKVLCWGSDGHHQLGDGADGGLPASRTPHAQQINMYGGWRATDLAVGTRHACAVTHTGEVRCWGLNSTGQGGIGGVTETIHTPDVVRHNANLSLTNATAISAGSYHTCALVNVSGNGEKVYCWGANSHGQINSGNGNHLPAPSPVNEQASPAVAFHAVDLAIGAQHSCAIDLNQAVRCWGRNQVGQLGRGLASPSNQSNPIPHPQTSIVVGIDGTAADHLFANGFDGPN